ncbi:MAG: DUF2799 domain-containing protein [Gammaproteobacteria bacterium]|nr:DUF2799 domain-containing protein [Gammaproteobacteria bacterium]
MNNWRILAMSAGLIALAGCGGMSANECELADWQAVGYEDGVNGRSTDRFGGHRKSCAKHEVAPDFQAYRTGRDAGLREYCQPARGYREGTRGARYVGVCPADLEPAFLSSYNEGRELYELESAVRTTSAQIQRRKTRMDEIETELTGVMADALSSDTSGEERAALLVKTKQLAEERVTLDNEVDELEVTLERRREELEAHRARM